MPKLKHVPEGRKGRIKEPIVEPGSTNALPPVFCLHYLDNKKYGLSNCEIDEKGAFADRLYELCQLTWNQIINTGRHGLGSEKIPQNAITGSNIPVHITKDVDFIAIRFDRLKPMVGYRRDRIFHIIWLDTKFQLYNHGR